jgi:hypothetical protein
VPLPDITPLAIDDDADPWQLIVTLKRLCARNRELRYKLAGQLERFHLDLLWRTLGFASFAQYCEQRLGCGRRRAERLIRFRRGLDRFDRLKAAYLEGDISYTAASLLLKILHSSTQEVWVRWASRITYRELERVVEYAETYVLPGADSALLDSYISELKARERKEAEKLAAHTSLPEVRESETVGAGSGPVATAFAAGGRLAGHPATAFAAGGGLAGHPATAFALPADADGAPPGGVAPNLGSVDWKSQCSSSIPLGYALPPSTPGGLPGISGVPDDLTFAPPELCLARIRFWVPADVLEMIYRALRRCRLLMSDPLRHTWCYLEVVLVHFIRSQDTPAARRIIRRHRIIARDKFRCSCPGCTSRAQLHGHHLEHKSQGGPDADWNLTAACAGHHQSGLHGGGLEMGGWAPDYLITRLGVNPRTGAALQCYVNDYLIDEETAKAELARWRQWLRELDSSGDPPVVRDRPAVTYLAQSDDRPGQPGKQWLRGSPPSRAYASTAPGRMTASGATQPCP